MNNMSGEPTPQIAPIKLEIPVLPTGYLSRPELIKRMFSLLGQRLACVVAPMGCGKTSMLVEFARTIQDLAQNPERSLPGGISNLNVPLPQVVAWLNVDSRDNDARRFWRHVFASLSRAVGRGGRIEDSISRILDAPITPASIERAAALLFEPAERRETVVILDGFHGTPEEEINEQILRFISFAPQEVRFVLSARELSQKMMRDTYNLGQVQLGYFDFLLSESQVAEMLEQAAPIFAGDVPDSADVAHAWTEDELHRVCDTTEGWAQGVSLAAQSMNACLRRGSAFVFGGSSNTVKRYFSAGVTGNLDADLFFAIEVLSVLERFSKPLFERIFVAYPGVRGRFDEMVNSGAVLMISCDEEGEWYRFNNLFASWLRHCVWEREPDAARKACLVAAEWFNKRGHVEEAAKYSLMSGDFDYAESIVEATSGLASRATGEEAYVWVSRVPSQKFSRSPLLSLLSAWAYNAAGRVKDTKIWIENFKRAAAESPKISDEEVETALMYMDAKLQAMVGDAQLALKMNEELLIDARLNRYSLQSMLYQSLGETNERIGNLKQAEEMYLQAQASASVDHTAHHLCFNMYSYANVRYNLGDFSESEATCNKLIEVSPSGLAFKGAAYALLSCIHVECNMLEEAERDIDQALANVVSYRNIDFYLQTKIAQASYMIAKNDYSSAYELISEAVMNGEQYEVPRNIQLEAYFKQGEIAASRKNLRDLQIIERRFAARVEPLDTYHQVMLKIITGYRLQYQDDTSAAAECFAKAVEEARASDMAFMESKALVALLLADAKKGVSQEGPIISRLIQLVSARGFVRVLLDGGAPMRDILRKYSSSRHASVQTRKVVKEILVLFERELHKSRSVQDILNAHTDELDNLTAREREVLGLLNMGMSRKEIADTLCVSINTAKKHLANTYAKLGVQNRDQALDAIAAAPEPVGE